MRATFEKAAAQDCAAGRMLDKLKDTGDERYRHHAITLLGRARKNYTAADASTSAEGCAAMISRLERERAEGEA